MNIGFAIKSVRTKASITQGDLAKKCKVSQTSLSQIELGTKQPTRKTVLKICRALDLPESIVYLLAIEQADIPEDRKNAYELIYPSLKALALQLVGDEHSDLNV